MRRPVLACLAAAALFGFAAPAVRAQKAPPGVKAHRDLAYVEGGGGGHARQRLDLYLPEGAPSAAAAAPLPVIVWVHGGGWQSGDRRQCPPLRQGFVGRGYAVASVGYRLSGDAPFPAQIDDVRAAVRWLRAHAREYNLDSGRVGAWGSSAGGHLVALLGTGGKDPDERVQAVCDFFGPTDLVRMAQTPGYESHARADSPEGRLLGGPVLENREKAGKADPVALADKADPPFLIVHGDRDPVVPPDQSRLLFDALRAAGVPVRLHTLRGAGHGGPGFSSPEVTEMVAAFFDRTLKARGGVAAKAEAQLTEGDAAVGPAPGGTVGPPRGRPTWGMLVRRDADGDGRLSRPEFAVPPPLFARLDRDGDGLLTREEFEAAPAPPGAPAGPRPAAGPSDAEVPAGFRLDGDRWTHRDAAGKVTRGVLLKPEGKGPFPAVLISHGMGGGAEGFGRDKAREMVRWGYVCIAPEYTHGARALGGRPVGPPARPSGVSEYGASADNLRRARVCVEVLRGMAEVDASRLFAYGHSMGGFVTIGLAAAEPGLLRAAAVTGSGLSRQTGFPAPAAEAARQVRSPFLILHGADDTTVRPEQSAALEEALKAGGVPVERHVFEGQGHPIDQMRREEVYRRVRAWFDKHGEKAASGAGTRKGAG